MVSLALIIATLCLKTICTEEIEIWKCCPKGMQLESETESCVQVEDTNVSFEETELIKVPIDDDNMYYWIPPKLRLGFNPLTVRYDKLADVKMDLSTILTYDESGQYKSTDLGYEINPSMVANEQHCYDIITNSTKSRIMFKSVKLKLVFKCCPKGEIVIDEKVQYTCKQFSHPSEDNDIEEIVKFPESLKIRWLPKNFSRHSIKVRYNLLKYGLLFNFFDLSDNIHWEIISTQPENETTMRIWNRHGTMLGVTYTFCFDEISYGYHTPRIVLAVLYKKKSKCCDKGMRLDVTSCINNPHIINPPDKNMLRPFYENYSDYWYPPLLHQVSLPLIYNVLSFYSDIDVVQLVAYEQPTESRFLENELRFHSLMVREYVHINCFDRLSNGTRVWFQGVLLKKIGKCCSKGERLDKTASRCESIPTSTPIMEIDKETVKSSEIHSWLPEKLSKYTVKVQYNVLKLGFTFNHVIPHNFHWTWTITESKDTDTTISLHYHDTKGKNVVGITHIFCFDEVEEGSLAPGVLLSFIPQAFKCCKKGEELLNFDSLCVRKPGYEVQDLKNEIVRWEDNSLDHYWLPTSLRHKSLSVSYNNMFIRRLYQPDTGMTSNERIWRLNTGSYHTRPGLKISLQDLSGRAQEVLSHDFCFEYLSDSGVVVLFPGQSNEYDLRKCCFSGEALSVEGYCVQHDGEDWSPGSSNLSNMIHPTVNKDIIEKPVKFECLYSSFQLHSPFSTRAKRHFQGIHVDHGRSSTTFFCNDWLLTGDGERKEVVGSCTYPDYSLTYERMRPLGVVAAALLAAAAVVAVAREETRRSAHGRALACHALCLATANSIHVTEFFKRNLPKHDCYSYTYSAYFFMMAANWWLTTITYNMFKNFRKPLGAMAAAARGASGAASGRAAWRRFAVMSLVAWGGAAALTGLTVAMHQHQEDFLGMGIVTPSFFETRSCFFIFEDYIPVGDEAPSKLSNSLGALCYFYVPTMMLTTANAVLVVWTSMNVRNLRRGTSILRRDEAAETGCFPQRHLQKIMFYAKLLLTTGVVELVVEAAAWSAQRERFASGFYIPMSKRYLFPIIATVVDLIRAVSVFWLSTGNSLGFRRLVMATWELLRKWVTWWLEVAWRWVRRLCDHQGEEETTNGIPLHNMGMPET